MSAAIGYATPEEGQDAKTGSHTLWLLFPDGKWYSPKDVSGLPQHVASTQHLNALHKRGAYTACKVLPRSRKGKRRRKNSN
jgi:hypothetical protein